MNKQPSLLKVVWIDFAAFTASLSPIVLWGVYFFLLITQKTASADPILPLIFAILSVIAVCIIIWRVQAFKAIFTDGIESTATIQNVSFFRDRGRIDYVYVYQGQKYSSGNIVHKVKQTQQIQVGEQMVLMIDRNHPKRAFIRNLYI